MKKLLVISILSFTTSSLMAQSGVIKVRKVKNDERYFMREIEDTSFQEWSNTIDCAAVICYKKNELGILGGGFANTGGPGYQIGFTMMQANHAAFTGLYYRSKNKSQSHRLHLFYQRSLMRVEHARHYHKIWSVGLDAGIELSETGVPSFEPYIGYSIPNTCFLNRFQANLGYRFVTNQNQEGNNTRNGLEFALWFYL